MGSSTGILCSFCDLLVGQTIQGLDREKEGKTYAEWLLSAQNGCPLCIYVVSDKAFECLQSDWQERPESMIYLTNWTRLRECPEIVYLWLSSDADRFDYPVRLRRCDSEDKVLVIADSTLSNQTFDIVPRWIDTCLHDHYHSKADFFGISTHRPTRLLELHEDGCRLCCSEDLGNHFAYVTLSHCWGTLELFKLTKSNMEMLLLDIPLWKLCQTFQDAIIVTRKLNYGYLWIDTLCIIQDDVEDWQKESSLMSEVYGNAVLNIAATHAKDGSAGLFHTRKPRKMSREFFRVTGSDVNWEISGQMQSDEIERLLGQSPLNQRGWAFQERLLAKRTLHFTTEQILFECRGYMISELHQIYHNTDAGYFPKHLFMSNWKFIVAEYSKRYLSRSEDKLVALSGIARFLQQKLDGQFSAGLWNGDLAKEIMWSCYENENPPQLYRLDPIPYRAPTWSWAATDFPINFDWTVLALGSLLGEEVDLKAVRDYHPLEPILIHDLAATCVPLGADPLGQIQYAELRLKCRPLLDRQMLLSRYPTRVRVRYDDLKLGVADQVVRDELFFGLAHQLYKLPEGYKSQAERHNEIPPVLEAVGFGDSPPNRDYHDMSMFISGIIVKPVGQTKRGYFTRLGVFAIGLSLSEYEKWRYSLAATDNIEDAANEALYEFSLGLGEDGIKQYTIVIL